MYKGHVKIELRDAKTNEITDVVESDNLVTDAVNNVLNGALSYCIATCKNGSNSTNNANVTTITSMPNSIVKDLFGGVLIFDKDIDVSEDKIIPDKDDILHCIGHAGQSQRITGDTFGGNFNLEESVFTDEYCTLVWDFESSCCNGLINSICLTSNRGGTVGLRHNASGVKGLSFASIRIGNDSWLGTDNIGDRPVGSLISLTGVSGNRLGLIGEDRIACIRGSNYIYANIPERLKLQNQISFKLSDRLQFVGGELPAISSTLENNDYTKYSYYTSFYSDKGIWCDDLYKSGEKVVYIYNVDGTVNVRTIDTYNFASAVRQIIGNSVNAIQKAICYWNDKLYMVLYYSHGNTNTSKYFLPAILNFDGTFVLGESITKDVFIDNDNDEKSGENVSFMLFNDGLYMTLPGSSGSSTGCSLYSFDEETAVIDTTPCFKTSFRFLGLMKESPYVKLPWMTTVSAMYDTSVNKLYFWDYCLFTSYFATINNIYNPLIKTADKTMKILYTLRQI